MSDEPKTTGEHPATNGEVKRDLKLQTLVLLLGLIGSVAGGAKWMVTSSWAQAKEHSDAGIAVIRAEMAAHVQEEAQSRKALLGQMQEDRGERRELRLELRSLYDFQKTGRPQPMLERPPPPIKDAGP